jgi:hypothetical protein
MAEEYLTLCRNPAGDVLRWLAEDRKRPGGSTRPIQVTTTRTGRQDANTTTTIITSKRQGFRAASHGLCRHALPAVLYGLDAHRQGGRGADNLFARQGASAAKYDRLRPLRIAVEGLTRRALRQGSGTGGGNGSAAAASFAAQADSITAEFARKVGALPATLTALERAAAIRALRDERDAALRALKERRAVVRRGEKEIRCAMRAAACRL